MCSVLTVWASIRGVYCRPAFIWDPTFNRSFTVHSNT